MKKQWRIERVSIGNKRVPVIVMTYEDGKVERDFVANLDAAYRIAKRLGFNESPTSVGI